MSVPTETLAGSKSFSETLREETEPKWSSAVDHRFVAEIHAGTIPDEVLGAYLVQDYRFLDSFLALVGGAIASADTYAARLRLAQFVNAIAVDENDYFQRAFAALGVTDEQLADTPNFVSTGSFIAMFREASRTLDYPAMLSVLLVTQWIYFDWTSKGETADGQLADTLPENWLQAEWITLHRDSNYKEFVSFLRAEFDRVGPCSLAAKNFFIRTVALELEFFDQAYDNPLVGEAR